MQTSTAIFPGNQFSAVLRRLVMQDAMKAVFEVKPEVRIKCCSDGKKFTVHAERVKQRD